MDLPELDVAWFVNTIERLYIPCRIAVISFDAPLHACNTIEQLEK